MIVQVASGQYSDYDVIKIVEMPLEDFNRYHAALIDLRKQSDELHRAWSLKQQIVRLEPHRKSEELAAKAAAEQCVEDINKLRQEILKYPEVESKRLWLG